MEKIETEIFDCFNVHKCQDCFSFVHIEIEDKPLFYEKMFDYFFSEDKILKYCENSTSIKFTPSTRDYVTLHKHLRTYIDSENLEKEASELDEILSSVLREEGSLEDKDGKKIVRLDKMGKIGEYIFCCLLSDYFHFDCIIPKVHYQTDYNMSIFGIDALYYSQDNDLLLFGESKMTLSLDNGVKLINASLKDYENQLENEFLLVLSGRIIKDKLNKFDNKFGETVENCFTIQEFIEDAEITKLGVPIFIAHGTDIDENAIYKKLKKIKKSDLLGIETTYYLISLPTIDKNKFIATCTSMIKIREDNYKNLGKAFKTKNKAGEKL